MKPRGAKRGLPTGLAESPTVFFATLLAGMLVVFAVAVFAIPPARAGEIPQDAAEDLAASLDISPCVLRAVLEVESGGRGFLPSGKPVIVFEGQLFWKALRQRGMDPVPLGRKHPGIVYEKWTNRHYARGEKEYARLEEAMAIHKEAALGATLWGAFQILGSNYKRCGYGDIAAFVEAQRTAQGQLRTFVAYLKANNLVEPLRKKDWRSFARKYNGPSYAKNGYDKKLEAAYKRCVARQGRQRAQ
ncbi:exported hypothetical protein [uncultured delta proteobacterium]|uniref:N-acetylmuramidase domain-containing protein n=1 Tax=uncultured delta proteobacterium TaxID=34034 RepID=A0A212JPF9_9DELT|nr:exported hypothetical protein [uncultured delta proteobacterium]